MSMRSRVRNIRHLLGIAGCLFVVGVFPSCQNPLEKALATKIAAVTDTALQGISVRVITANGSSTELPGLAPAFNADVTEYSAVADSLVTKVAVVASPRDAEAKLEWRMGEGGWQVLASGAASDDVAVATGTNRIAVRVTSESGLESAVYTVALNVPALGAGKPAVLIDSEATANMSWFGHQVAMSDDGLTLVVGGTGRSCVYVYSRSSIDASWPSTPTRLYAHGDQTVYLGFGGYALTISGNGKVIAAAYSDQFVDLFAKDVNGNWNFTKTLSTPQSDSHYGCSVALSHDGSTLAIGAYSYINTTPIGAVCIYGSSDGYATHAVIPSPVADRETWFGYAVALSDDGKTAVVGAPHDVTNADMSGAIHICRYSSGSWAVFATMPGPSIPSSEFGRSVAISDNGNYVLAGAPGMYGIASVSTGAAYLCSWNGVTLAPCGSAVVPAGSTAQAKVGWSVALSPDGLHAAIGAYQYRVSGIDKAGATFLYDVGAGGLSLERSFLNPHPVDGDGFGYSVELGDGSAPPLAIGADRVKPGSIEQQGVVFAY